MGIEGNDRADSIAKAATELKPATETTTVAKLHRQLRAKLKSEAVGTLVYLSKISVGGIVHEK